MSLPRCARRARIRRWALAIGMASGSMATAAGPGSARASADPDDWSLERKANDPGLVSARFSKLRRNPFDQGQWRALTRALGVEALTRKISALRQSEPNDVALTILEARARLAGEDPRGAQTLLEGIEPKAGRWKDEVFSMRIDALQAAGDARRAVELLEQRAGASDRDAAARSLRERAYELADQHHQDEAALRLAKTLWEDRPQDFEAALRVARSAARARDPELADRAYEVAVREALARRKDEITAEQAQARLDADRAAGAAELLWSLVQSPRQGTRVAREQWWETLTDAHRRAGTADVFVGRLGPWLDEHPKEAAAWRALAVSQESAGMDATPAWRRALELDPRDTDSRTALIEALETQGASSAAVEEYRRLLARDSSEVQTGLDLANRLIAGGQRELAMQLAKEIEDAVGRRSHGLLLLLDFYNLNEEPELALAVAQRLVATHSRDPEARIALGEQLYQMNRLHDAMDQWAMLPKLVRPSHKGWARHAQVLSEHGRTSDAIASLKRALKVAPKEPQYLRLRAVLAEEQRRPQQALQLWEQVAEHAMRPEHALLREEARTRRVELLVGGSIPKRRLKLERAEADATAVLEQGEPLEESLESGLFLAELYTRQENYGAAVMVAHRLLELDPDNPDRLSDLAAAQRRAGQVQSALGTLEELMTTRPGRKADVLAEMSELAFEAGDTDRALSAATKAARQDRAHIDALVRLGQLHERSGDIEAAAEAYQKALDTQPTDGRARLRLAELELTRGRTERSAALFREILEHGGPPELLREAGRRALDLAEASDSTLELLDLAVRRTVRAPEADEPREFLLEALDRVDAGAVEAWLEHEGERRRDDERIGSLRRPLVTALGRGSIGVRLRASGHLGRLGLPDTAVPLAEMGASLAAPRDSTTTVREAFERARVSAIRSAGALRDPRAVPVFASLLADTSNSTPTREAAAWALARTQTPEAIDALAPHLSTTADPTVTALACLALAQQPRAIDAERAQLASELAHYVRHEYVRHACAFAEAALTPASKLERMREQLASSDPVLAAIAAWRLGYEPAPTETQPEAQPGTSAKPKPQAETLRALFRRFIGPPGLPRDAAGAALARLLEGQVGRSEAPLPPPRGRGWSTAVERWLERQIAPRYEPLPGEAVLAHVDALGLALEDASRGTRAERQAAQDLWGSCPSDSTDRDREAQIGEGSSLCLLPLTKQSIKVASRRN